ncbi:hypothetical protein BDZ97DRAFT_1912592 [Flammula alnicola]|nr:hypothetical protein BDZ97DRAFT_1912592 [Flammula alnicola]
MDTAGGTAGAATTRRRRGCIDALSRGSVRCNGGCMGALMPRRHGCHDEATTDEATTPWVCNNNTDATGGKEQQLLLLFRCHAMPCGCATTTRMQQATSDEATWTQRARGAAVAAPLDATPIPRRTRVCNEGADEATWTQRATRSSNCCSYLDATPIPRRMRVCNEDADATGDVRRGAAVATAAPVSMPRRRRCHDADVQRRRGCNGQ